MLFFRRNKCKIVYRSEYFAGIHAQNSRQTFDVMKYKRIRDQLTKKRLLRPEDILSPEKLTEKDMLLVHEKKYLQSLRDPMVVGRILNLDYVNPWDDYILEYFKYVSGGTVLAAEVALEENIPVFNLGGGYHHAHPNRGEGFCLINDVAIAIRKLQKEKKCQRFLIVDLDYHQGNGNLLYFKKDEKVFTFSMHANNWVTISGKKHNFDIELPAEVEDSEYLAILNSELAKVFETFSPDLVIYVAGSDPFEKDTLGDFKISEKGMLERDKTVYRFVRSRDIPLAILAAGGYGPESWKIYFNFIKWVIKRGK
jgi:histone deacetylase 11